MQQAAEAVDYLTTPQHSYNGRKIAIYHRALSPDSLQLFEEKGKVQPQVGYSCSNGCCLSTCWLSLIRTPSQVGGTASKKHSEGSPENYSLAGGERP